MKIAVITGASAGIGREFVYAVDKYDSFDEIWVIARRRERLEELASKHEIDGVEVWHQSADEQYRAQLQDIAAANGLLVTGGSEFHGFYNHYAIQIGSNTTPEESLNRIITHKGKA